MHKLAPILAVLTACGGTTTHSEDAGPLTWCADCSVPVEAGPDVHAPADAGCATDGCWYNWISCCNGCIDLCTRQDGGLADCEKSCAAPTECAYAPVAGATCPGKQTARDGGVCVNACAIVESTGALGPRVREQCCTIGDPCTVGGTIAGECVQ